MPFPAQRLQSCLCLLMFLALLPGCERAKQAVDKTISTQVVPPPSQPSVEQGANENDGLQRQREADAQEKAQLAAHADVVARRGGVLIIRADDGTAVEFFDETTCEGPDDCVTHHFKGRLPELHAYFVHASRWEWKDWALAGQADGSVTMIGDEPRTSPDGKHFAVAGGRECCGYNGVQIWSNDQGKFSMVFQHLPKAYGRHTFKDWGEDESLNMFVTAWVEARTAAGVSDPVIRDDLPGYIHKTEGKWTYAGPAEITPVWSGDTLVMPSTSSAPSEGRP